MNPGSQNAPRSESSSLLPTGETWTETTPLLVGDEEESVEETTVEDGSRADYELPGPRWIGYVIAVLPVFVCMFGAGRETWSMGIASILVGLVLVLLVPQRRLPKLPIVCLLGMTAAPLLAFLPSSWLQGSSEWRRTLTQDWDIHLSNTLTPQAAVSLENWFFLVVGLAWLAWCLARGFSSNQRRAIIQTLAVGGILLSLFSILEKQGAVSIPVWPRDAKKWGEAFGPFANRNHISSLAAMTCVLCAAAAFDAHRRKSRTWIVFVAGFILPTSAIFMNTSKAGVILMFFGLTVWLGTSAMGKGFFKQMAVGAALVLVIATLLVISGGGVGNRVMSGELQDLAGGGLRASLMVETLSMMVHSPWLGVGLGNFDAVFPVVTHLHEPRSRFHHPESDILWLLSEGGLLTVIPALILVLWVYQSTGPWFGKRKKSSIGRLDRKLRNAAGIAMSLGIVHGLVDVPNHGLGFALVMSLLIGVAIRPRKLQQAAGLVDGIVFRLAGVGAILLGGFWVAIALGHPILPGASAAQTLRTRAINLTSAGHYRDALALTNDALHMAPMDFLLYYERARLRLALGQPAEEALMDFSRSRALEPHYAALCHAEGVYWLGFDPRYSTIGWREFLRRYPAAAPGIHGHYRMMLNHASQHPELRESLWSLATSVDLKFDYLEGVTTREEFDKCLRSLLTQQPELTGLDSTQRERLFNLWYERGNQAALISALESTPKWRDDGWRILAEHYARNSDFKRACETVMPYLPSIIRTAPGTSTDIPTLERALLYNPTDARRGIDLFQAQKTQGDIDGALRTLEKVSAIPNAPPYVRQEIAALYIMKQDFRRAWEQLREAMQKR
jgi:tetratricopeptide (TPR) repeat protein